MFELKTPTTTFRGLISEEVALLLRRNLGAGRVWSDFLADVRRGKSNGIKGLKLEPYASGKMPLYHPVDVAHFIKKAPVLDPTLMPEPLVAEFYRIPDIDGLHWRMRRAVRVHTKKK